MKRILIFSLGYYPTHVSGAEIAIKEITDRIASHDIEFHLIAAHFDSTQSREQTIGNVHVHRVGVGKKGASVKDTHHPLFYLAKMLYVPCAVIRFIRLNRKHSFDGLWAMMTYMVFPIALTRIVGVRVPYVVTLQDGDPYEYVFKRWYIRPFGWLLTYGFRNATIVQTISTYLASWAKRAGAVCPIEVVPNAVNTVHFSRAASHEELRAIHEQIGQQRGDTFLITTSRLVHKNAVDVVIRALALLPSSVKFAILGEGPDEHMLRDLTRTIGVEDRVAFLGQVENRMLPTYLKACDIFIRPSRSEGMGISFIEAMAASVPVIATQEGGIADFLFDAQRNPGKEATGFAVDVDSPEQIAQQVAYIRANPEKVEQVVATARAMAVERYDWDLIAREMQERVFSRLWEK